MEDKRFYELLTHLGRGGAYQLYWTPNAPGGEKLSRWFAVGDTPSLPGWNADVYFSVHPTTWRRSEHEKSHNEDIAAANCLYTDFDGETDLAALLERLTLRALPAPSVVVASGGGLHAYWLLDAPVMIDDAAQRTRCASVQRAWVQLVGGDKTVTDLARVLRVPGTLNRKPKYAPNFPTVQLVRFEMAVQYEFAALEALVAPLPAAAVSHTGAANRSSATAGGLNDQALLDVLFRAKNGTVYRQLWDGDLSPAGGDHSRADQMLCNGLAWLTGRDEGRMNALFRQSGLMRQKWERDDYRQRTISSAVNSAQTVYDPAHNGHSDPAAVAAAQSAIGLGRLNGAVSSGSGGNGTPPPINSSSGSSSGGGQGGSQPGGGGGAGVTQPGLWSWPYEAKKGQIILHRVDKVTGQPIEAPVCDFTASIVEEVTREDGERLFVIDGTGKRGGAFRLTLNGEQIGEERRLRAALEGAVGALDPVFAGMVGHLGPAIKKLTDPAMLRRVRRYSRTGWEGKSFLLPGREPPGVEIDLHRKLPYGYDAQATDVQMGIDALVNLIESVGPQKTTPIVAHILAGPLAKTAGWRNERYALFVKGLTGTFKTSVVQVGMCLYGDGFMDDTRLVKWGEGATRNAIMALATQAHDIALMIDNYKPNTGSGDRDFINLIHNILEGGEKDRLNRNVQLRETRAVHCWPIVTGEDAPSSDAASLARVLLVNFEKRAKQNNDPLTKAQQLAPHLPAIGAAWLEWIEGPGEATIRQIGAELPQLRSKWAGILQQTRTDVTNPMRVATNLAINELALKIASQHPLFGPVLAVYQPLHRAGLEDVAHSMAEATAESIEALRFLAVLRELLATERAILVAKGSAINTYDRDRAIGWRETDGSGYVLMDMARSLVERHLGERLNSNRQIYSQMEDLGFIQSADAGRQTKSIKIGTQKHRTVHLRQSALEG